MIGYDEASNESNAHGNIEHSFKASAGSLHRFKARHGIHQLSYLGGIVISPIRGYGNSEDLNREGKL